MHPKAKVITVGELAEYLRVHRSTLYRLLKKGQLPGFKIGSDWRFNVEAIDQWRMQQGAALNEILTRRSRDHALNKALYLLLLQCCRRGRSIAKGGRICPAEPLSADPIA
jgi:excisionase family DNA binding protein